MKGAVSAAFLAVLVASGVHAQGLTSAQMNYKACPLDAKKRGVEIVKPVCGEPPRKTVDLPSFEEAMNRITTDQLARYEEMLKRLRVEVRQYQQCINNQVMSNGMLPTSTLDLAACADQFAVVDQLGALQEEWTLACAAHNFSEGNSDYPTSCEPQAG